MIGLKQSYEIEYDGTENCARMDLFADTAADLTGLTHFDNIKLLQGSDALDISTGYHWIKQSGSNWIRQPASGGGGGDTYTREEIDEFLADKQELLTWGHESAKDSTDSLTSGAVWSSVWSQILGVNTTKNLSQDVPETGYDCNTLTDPGIYRVPSAAVAADIANIPTQAAGRLIVSNLGLGNRYIQIYLPSGARVFIRSYVSTGWQPWYEYQGIENMTNYAWGNYNVAESTGAVNPSTTRIGTEEYFPISGGAVLTYSAYRSSQGLQTFYLFYDSSQSYLGEIEGTGYIGWVDCGIPIKVPSQARYYRLCFRRSGNQTITPSELIKCTRQTG